MDAIECEYRPASAETGSTWRRVPTPSTDAIAPALCGRTVSTVPRCSHTPCHDRKRSEGINRRNTATFELSYRGALHHAGHGSVTPTGLVVSMAPAMRGTCPGIGEKVVTVLVISTTLTVSVQMHGHNKSYGGAVLVRQAEEIS